MYRGKLSDAAARFSTFVRKYSLTRRSLKNTALCYIRAHSTSAIRPVLAFGTVRNYERWKPNKFSTARGFSFETRTMPGGDFARRRGIMQSWIDVTENFHFAKHSVTSIQ